MGEMADVPDMKMEDEPQKTQNGLICFLNDTRECGSDCMAYTPEPAESPSLSIQQRNCTLLVAAERLGRYSAGIASVLNKMHTRATTAAADNARLTRLPNLDPSGKA